MNKLFIVSLGLLTGSATWSQGASGSNGQTPAPGAGSGVASFPAGGHGMPIPQSTFKAQCIGSLAAFAADRLQAQLIKDKAVTKQVLAAAGLSEAGLGASCNKLCDDYAYVANKISWAHVSPGFLSEPEHTLQKTFKAMPQPAMPGKTELASCLPQQATMNWCPPSGSGVGAGPSRIENPLDKIPVCISGGDALQHMNFSAADAARNCARPAIVDAADRIKAEHACVADAVKAEQKAATDKAAANGVAQLPKAPLGMAPTARQKP